jgi:calcium-dependent protein kinase
LKKLDHPNIIRLIEAYRSEEELYLVTELCKGDNLIKDLRARDKPSEVEAAYIIWQILQAVNYCHR